MALFSNYDIAVLTGEASQHKTKMLEKDLQPYNDILFNKIRAELEARHDEIIDQLQEKIRNAPERSRVVSVPLWSYNVRHFNQSRADYDADLMKLSPLERTAKIQADRSLAQTHVCNGWQWMIGVSSGSSYTWDDDFAIMQVDTNWSLRQVPVDLVLRKTDLLLRLTNLFHEHVWVTRDFSECVRYYDECKIDKMVIHAHFYMDGFARRGYWKRSLKDTKAKYAKHARYVLEEGQKIVLTGPGLEPLQTPPGSPRDVETPDAPRRARAMSSESMPPLIHSYEGPSALSNAARDTLAGVLDEDTPCHCNCCH